MSHFKFKGEDPSRVSKKAMKPTAPKKPTARYLSKRAEQELIPWYGGLGSRRPGRSVQPTYREIRALERSIIAAVEKDKPTNPMSLGFTFSSGLSIEDVELLEEMEKWFGENRCNRWMCTVLLKTEHFKREDDDHVSAQEVSP